MFDLQKRIYSIEDNIKVGFLESSFYFIPRAGSSPILPFTSFPVSSLYMYFPENFVDNNCEHLPDHRCAFCFLWLLLNSLQFQRLLPSSTHLPSLRSCVFFSLLLVSSMTFSINCSADIDIFKWDFLSQLRV